MSGNAIITNISFVMNNPITVLRNISKTTLPIGRMINFIKNEIHRRKIKKMTENKNIEFKQKASFFYGSLPDGLSKAEFFEGYSIIRNKELMRIFKDLDLVEQLGSGIPRILQAYSKDCFHFSENFLRVVLPSSEPVTKQVAEQDTERVTPQDTPQDTMQDTMQVTMQVGALLKVFTGVHTREELQKMLGLSDREHFRKTYLQPAIEAGFGSFEYQRNN